MKKTTLIILTVFIFILSGCGDAPRAQQGNFFTDSNQNNNNNNVVINDPATPLSCDRENDQYYDFIDTNECIRPVTYEQLYILDKFHLFNKLASETPEEVIKIRVGFKEYIDAATYEQLIVVEGKIVEIETLGLFYPLIDKNGLPSHYQPRSNETVIRTQMLQAAHNESISIFSSIYLDDNNTNPLYNRQNMETYSLAIVEVSMKTSDVPIWWEMNKTKIRYIQALLSDLDYVQTPYYPRIQIGPKDLDQEIDWTNQ